MSQGWKYGPERNDDELLHNCLVPYAYLTNEEKEYDRNTSMGTLKLVVGLGYKIEKPSAGTC
jgi:hypothetical protein